MTGTALPNSASRVRDALDGGCGPHRQRRLIGVKARRRRAAYKTVAALSAGGEVATMNARILSLILCGATPTPAGDCCQVMPLRVGVSRDVCHAELAKWRQHASRPRLECTEDPALVEADDDEAVILDDGEDAGL
ncbi:MAG: hypothetical protein KF889_19245 [Alphaproteobacteria bacterium]|nr:hypothetical protein [Alphaproteobacteria bacterium]